MNFETLKELAADLNGINLMLFKNDFLKTALNHIIDHPDYHLLAGRIECWFLQREVIPPKHSFTPVIDYFTDELKHYIIKNNEALKVMIRPERDYLFKYMGISTLKKSYLFHDSEHRIIETPQMMYMRIATALWFDSDEEDKLAMIKKTYDAISLHYLSFSTPIMYNAGFKKQGMISCFLQALSSDSIEGICDMWRESALYHKYCGGLATHIHNLRAKGTIIEQFNEPCDGIVPPLSILQEISNYINQGKKRPGSHAIYLSVHHREIITYLKLFKAHGTHQKTNHLFAGLWVPDFFFECVEKNKPWYLMCPYVYQGLDDVFGQEFVDKYLNYVAKAKSQGLIIKYGDEDLEKHGSIIEIPARKLFDEMLSVISENGYPYICAKDSMNKKSMQSNIGVIKSSNLCTEISLVSNEKETAVCCLASIKISQGVTNGIFDFEWLKTITDLAVKCLNRVLDINFYPTEKAKRSALRHRPIGIGIQDLAAMFFKLNISYDSNEAIEMNRKISEHIYQYAIEASIDLAKKYGPYETFEGSPYSKGILQFDLWKEKPHYTDWINVKEKLKKYGIRNSTLIALMPTASSAQIIDSFESFEPIFSNVFVKKTLSGEYLIINQYLVKDLIESGLWNERIRDKILLNRGTIQNITDIPERIRNKFKTVYEIGMKCYIDQRSDAAPFICQSQSMNIYPRSLSFNHLYSAYFYAWKKGLKTISYYTRGQAAHRPYQVIKFENNEKQRKKMIKCDSIQCESCSA